MSVRLVNVVRTYLRKLAGVLDFGVAATPADFLSPSRGGVRGGGRSGNDAPYADAPHPSIPSPQGGGRSQAPRYLDHRRDIHREISFELFESYGWLAPCAVAFLVLCLAGTALADTQSPFGVGRPDAMPSGPPGAFTLWLAAQASQFYQSIAATVRAAKANGSANIALVGLSFAYGVFHAAGPGHGKAVISSYLFATDDTLKRGVALSFAFAAVQAVSAILIVSVIAAILGSTAARLDDAALWLERLSDAAIALFGAWLFWRKGRMLWGLIARRFGWPGALVHEHGADCGHIPLPQAERDAARRGGLTTILAAGLRPCTGAIFVLVFALRQGIYSAGILATFAMALGTAVTVTTIAIIAVSAKGLAVRLASPESFAAMVSLRLAEALLALLVLLLGLALLTGFGALPAPV